MGSEAGRAPSDGPRTLPGGRVRRPSPAAVLEQPAVLLERADLDPWHGVAELTRGGGDALRIVVMRGRLDDRAGALLRVGRFEDPRAHEVALGAELHHQRRVRR